MSLGDENPSPFYPLPFQPQIRQINASAQGPVWEQHHSSWAQTEGDCLSALLLPITATAPCLSLAEPAAHSSALDDGLQWEHQKKRAEPPPVFPPGQGCLRGESHSTWTKPGTSHGIKKQTYLQRDAFSKEIHHKRSHLALAPFSEVQISGKSSSVSVGLVFQIQGGFLARFYKQQLDRPLPLGCCV